MAGVDIGRDPPLSLGAQPQDQTRDRRRLSLRWLACTTLTGLAGGALMGGALFIAFDGEANFAEVPRLQGDGPRLVTDGSGGTFGAGKGNRLVVLSERISNRQVIQETSVRSVAGKEFVKVTPYVMVTASLALTRGEHAEKAPPFNPLKIFADVGAVEDDQPETAAREEEHVTISFSPLATVSAALDEAPGMSEEAIQQTIREIVQFDEMVAYAPPVLPPSLDGGIAAQPAAAATLGFRLAGSLQANVTSVAKRAATVGDIASEEVDVTVQAGDTLTSILIDHGATQREAADMLSAIDPRGVEPQLQPGQEIRLTVGPAADDPDRHRPLRVTLPQGAGSPVTVALAAGGAAVRMPASIEAVALRGSAKPGESRTGPRANIYDGLYETGLEHDVPQPLIDQLVRIFSFDVDYQRTVSPGDMLELFFAETGEEEGATEPEILYAAVSLRGETRRFYRFRTPDDGVIDFYDETGKSAKKFLMRKPLSGGVFRSGYGMRRHPILGYSRMHTGADWAARTGTPIMAAGNGVVEMAGNKSGYGKHIEIRHANGYQTTYSHLSSFARDLREGEQVRQGQIIGYVGSTGLSTGPHLHYEVKVNGHFVDPMRIRLPRGRVLDGRLLAAFEKEKARIEALMNRAPASTRVAAAQAGFN